MTPHILPLHSLRSLKKKLICIFGKPVDSETVSRSKRIYFPMHMANMLR